MNKELRDYEKSLQVRRDAVQHILEKHGAETINAAKSALCFNCIHFGIVIANECRHSLSPINHDGSDCIYFQQKGLSDE